MDAKITTEPLTAEEAADLPEVLDARAAAWAEHQQRCAENRPYTDLETTEDLRRRIDKLRAEG